jgi:hypothetical protein
MDEKILGWLEKSGYPLELYVASELQKAGYLCSKSGLYEDINTAQPREIDVVGYHHGLDGGEYAVTRKIIVECKRSEKPVLALCATNNLRPRYEHQLFHGDPENLPGPDGLACVALKGIPPEDQSRAVAGFSEVSPSAYSLVSAFSGTDANLYAGLMGLVGASTFHRRLQKQIFEETHDDLSLHIQDRNVFEFQVACLVVDAPLYNVMIASSGRPLLERSNWSIVMVQLPWNFNPHEDSDRYCVHVVTKEYFHEFLHATELLANFVGKQEHVQHLLSTTPRRNGLAWDILRRLKRPTLSPKKI